jgi:hypothetical protein
MNDNIINLENSEIQNHDDDEVDNAKPTLNQIGIDTELRKKISGKLYLVS